MPDTLTPEENKAKYFIAQGYFLDPEETQEFFAIVKAADKREARKIVKAELAHEHDKDEYKIDTINELSDPGEKGLITIVHAYPDKKAYIVKLA